MATAVVALIKAGKFAVNIVVPVSIVPRPSAVFVRSCTVTGANDIGFLRFVIRNEIVDPEASAVAKPLLIVKVFEAVLNAQDTLIERPYN